ncbi:calsequestrin-1-like [Actinia tenebrosa]|uniref:Calsequestrin n=1 Tax=Actinia tenebrosa TaxID=6105 RepID=A0A6P8I4Q8_ACTTE|nr:calsequestrin-1-like [Actinia tenebrosa]
MRRLKDLLVAVLFASLVIQCVFSQEVDDIDSQGEQLPSYLRDDGIKRVATLKQSNFERTLKHTKMLVVLFYMASKEHPESEKAWKSDEQMLEVVARVLQPQGVTVGVVNVEKDYALAQALGVKFAGAILIFHRGKKVDYFGHRSADVLISYLHKMFEPPLTVIETKKQRKTFEDTDSSKVVGYFEKGSPQYEAFEEAAKNYQPLIPFFVVSDKKQAKPFRLKKINTFQLHKPFEKPITFTSDKDSVTEESIKQFITKNKKQVIAKIRLEDIHDVWSARVEGFLITAFVRPKTEDGAKFFSLVKKLAREVKDNEKLTFVWVDPDPFPMMREFWQKSYKIDVNSPAIGVVDPKLNRSSWFKKKGKEPKLKHMLQWIQDVLNNKVQFTAANDENTQQAPPPPQQQQQKQTNQHEQIPPPHKFQEKPEL